MPGHSVEMQIALIQRDIQEIKLVLYGSSSGRKGLVDQIEIFGETADRGRWVLKAVLWLGGSTVAVLTALGQMRSAWTTFWGHS